MYQIWCRGQGSRASGSVLVSEKNIPVLECEGETLHCSEMMLDHGRGMADWQNNSACKEMYWLVD